MKIAVVILCRYNSSRLPGKILMSINNKTILHYIVDRVKEVFAQEDIIVATSNHPSDQPIVDYCNKNGFNFFLGDLNNVADRFCKAAQSLDATYAIRINGDNLFVDIPLLRSFKELLSTSEYDFVSNVKDRTFPKGMSIEAVKVDYYLNQLDKFEDQSDFEHVTSFLYKYPPVNAFYFFNTLVPEAAGIQLAIDTMEDFEMATAIINQMKGNPEAYNLTEIYSLYKNIK